MAKRDPDRLLKMARARVILPAAGGVWTAAAVAHAHHVGTLPAALGMVAATAVTRSSRARPATGAVAAAGVWACAATDYGPLAGPYHVMTITWGAAALAALIAAHRHPSVRDAKRWRAARRKWLGVASRYGLHQSHLIDHEETRLGVRDVYDITDTGRLASQIVGGSLAERIAQDERLPLSRIQIRSPRPGLIEVSRRYKDPWKHPIPHPVLADDPELHLPVPCTVREPLPVGQDPETGRPLMLTLWDRVGGKTVLVVSKRGGGKTTLLNCIKERVTAASDALPLGINVSKGQEDHAWEDAMTATAAGAGERKKAVQILQIVRRIIDERGALPRATATFQPSAGAPLVVVIIDEIDALTAGTDRLAQAARAHLAYIASKGRSEGVALIIAGQRGTADWLGGSNVRTQIDYVCLGKVNRRGEMMHAAGDMGLLLPDMATYGEGHEGVWVIAEVGADYQAGRTFDLSELEDIRTVVASRLWNGEAGEPVTMLEPAILYGDTGRALATLITGSHPAPRPVATVPHSETEPLSAYEAEVSDLLTDDLRSQLAAIDAKNADTRRILAETAQMAAQVADLPKDKLAEAAAARWRKIAEQTTIPDDARERLLTLLAGEGISAGKAAEVLGVPKTTMRRWLERLRYEGLAHVVGQKRGARWCLITPRSGDGT